LLPKHFLSHGAEVVGWDERARLDDKALLGHGVNVLKNSP